jgi:hypothetical protein
MGLFRLTLLIPRVRTDVGHLHELLALVAGLLEVPLRPPIRPMFGTRRTGEASIPQLVLPIHRIVFRPALTALGDLCVSK